MKRTMRTLTELQRLKSFKARRGIREVLIELPGSSAEIRKLEAQINKSLKACGCELSAVFAAIGLLTLGVIRLLAPNYLIWTSSKTLVGIAGFVVALALIGKIIGLAIANRKLHMAIDKIKYAASRMAPRER